MKSIYSIPALALALLLAPLAWRSAAAQESRPDRARMLPKAALPVAPEKLILGGSGSPEASAAPGTADPTLPARLQAALESTLSKVDARVRRGVSAAVKAPGLGLWTGTAGYSASDTAVTPDMRFEIGSISKTFVALTVLQLAEEGKLSLDDSIGRWLPRYQNVDTTITIRQLLGHTSGLYDYINDDTTNEILSDAYLFTPNRFWTPEELLGYVRAPHFMPGAAARYSNTNYILLGMIIEKITGRKVAEEYRRRFLGPLNLSATYSGWEGNVLGVVAHGWTNGFDPADPLAQTDIFSIPTTGALSSAWTAGGMISTAADLALWADAAYGGRLLDASSMKAMLTFRNSDVGDLGLGAIRWSYKNKILYGHTGGVLGFNSWMFSIPSDSISVAILLNSFDGGIDVGMSSFGAALLGEIYRVVSGVAAGNAMAGGALLIDALPNPSGGAASVRYTLPTSGRVTIEILDALGCRVALPVNDLREAGSYVAPVDLSGVPDGVYFCALSAGGRRLVYRIQIVR